MLSYELKFHCLIANFRLCYDSIIFMLYAMVHRPNMLILVAVLLSIFFSSYTHFSYTRENVYKKLTDDPLWEEVERKEDPKGLMIAVTKITTLASSGN